ncbi:MAG: CPBP family glutamic-type intramembrane protease [Pseudomonadota bacterium]
MTSPTTSPDTHTGPTSGQGTFAAIEKLQDTLRALAFLPPDAIDAVVDVAQVETVAPDEIIFEEGDAENTLIVVLEGHVLLSRHALYSELPLGSVSEGGFLGQLSFLDASTRTVTAKAGSDPVTIARITSVDVLLAENGDQHFDALRAGLVVPVVRSLREQSKALVVAMEDRQRFAGFFLFMIAIIYGCMLIYFLVAEQFVTDTTSQLFAWQNAAILVIPSIIVVYRLQLGYADLGLQNSEFRASLIGGLIWSAVTTAVFVGTFYLVRAVGMMPDFERAQAFSMLDFALYFPHTFVQEFVARGIIQNGYQRFFDDESGYRSVLFASFVFAIAHIPIGVGAVVLTFFGGVLFGLFFLKYRHLIGVTLVHFAVGGSAIALGLI